MKSIRRHLTLALLPGFGLLLVLSSVAIYFFTRVALLEEFDAGLQAKAANIMSLAEQGEDGIQIELPEASSPGGNRDLLPQFFEVWQTNGVVCARSPSLNGADLPQRFGSPAQSLIWDFALPDGGSGRAIGLKFLPKTEDEDAKHIIPREAIVVVAADRRPLDRTLAVLATVLVVTGLLTIAISVPLIGISLRRGHAPLGELARQAAAINADSLQMRFPVATLPEELQPIAKRLNDLLGRLESSFERERRFSADLAHELRTPLAELRAHAEVELEWAPGGEAEKHRETLNIALQMEAMVTRLLELARSENGKISPQFESVRLAPLIEEVWRPLDVRAKAKHLDVQIEVSPDASLRTDRILFRSILANLLSNAVEYAPEHGRVEVAWLNDAEELKVSNTVHDLSPDDVPHLFERLWRKDKSRTGNEHCGLGLALSREFASLLGVNLKAAFSDRETLTLSVKP
jgi:two-component system sensor histidine kinase QseC